MAESVKDKVQKLIEKYRKLDEEIIPSLENQLREVRNEYENFDLSYSFGCNHLFFRYLIPKTEEIVYPVYGCEGQYIIDHYECAICRRKIFWADMIPVYKVQGDIHVNFNEKPQIPENMIKDIEIKARKKERLKKKYEGLKIKLEQKVKQRRQMYEELTAILNMISFEFDISTAISRVCQNFDNY